MGIMNHLSLYRNRYIAGLVAVTIAGGGTVMAVNNKSVPAMQTSESLDYYNNADYSELVDFYRGVCPPFNNLRAIGDTFGEANEKSLGDSPEKRVSSLGDIVLKISDSVSREANRVDSLSAPSVSILDQTEPVSYEPARNESATVLREASKTLRLAVDSNSPKKVSDATEDDKQGVSDDMVIALNDAVSDAGSSVSRFSDVMDKAQLPTQSVFNLIRDAPECKSLLEDPVVPDDKPHGPTVSLWKAANRAHDGVSDSMGIFGSEEERASLVTADDVAREYNKVADSMTAGADGFAKWLKSNHNDPVKGDLDAARDGEKSYRDLASRVREAADLVHSDVDKSADIMNGVMIDEGRVQMRIHRLAKPVNKPTADALDKLKNK